jgi:hypothetical protein
MTRQVWDDIIVAYFVAQCTVVRKLLMNNIRSQHCGRSPSWVNHVNLCVMMCLQFMLFSGLC